MPTFYKPTPRLLQKRMAKAGIAQTDRAENAIVKRRSLGRCEVVEVAGSVKILFRCERRANHIHHLKAGIGRRNVGDSITALCKLHVCDQCHREIHGHVLRPVNGIDHEDARRVRYERIT